MKIDTIYAGGSSKAINNAVSKGSFLAIVKKEVGMNDAEIGRTIVVVGASGASGASVRKMIAAFNTTGLPHDEYKLLQFVEGHSPDGYAYVYDFDEKDFWRVGTETKKDAPKQKQVEILSEIEDKARLLLEGKEIYVNQQKLNFGTIQDDSRVITLSTGETGKVVDIRKTPAGMFEVRAAMDGYADADVWINVDYVYFTVDGRTWYWLDAIDYIEKTQSAFTPKELEAGIEFIQRKYASEFDIQFDNEKFQLVFFHTFTKTNIIIDLKTYFSGEEGYYQNEGTLMVQPFILTILNEMKQVADTYYRNKKNPLPKQLFKPGTYASLKPAALSRYPVLQRFNLVKVLNYAYFDYPKNSWLVYVEQSQDKGEVTAYESDLQPAEAPWEKEGKENSQPMKQPHEMTLEEYEDTYTLDEVYQLLLLYFAPEGGTEWRALIDDAKYLSLRYIAKDDAYYLGETFDGDIYKNRGKVFFDLKKASHAFFVQKASIVGSPKPAPDPQPMKEPSDMTESEFFQWAGTLYRYTNDKGKLEFQLSVPHEGAYKTFYSTAPTPDAAKTDIYRQVVEDARPAVYAEAKYGTGDRFFDNRYNDYFTILSSIHDIEGQNSYNVAYDKGRKAKLAESDMNYQIGMGSMGQETPKDARPVVILGRSIEILLPNGEKHRGQFAIVELDDIKASHNERTFADTPGYPLNAAGGNVNDRNYAGDPNAQAQVIEYARNLQPERLVTTSRIPSGTPIIDEKGIVVSGNNRTMSMKLAVSDYPDRYAAYRKFLEEEFAAFSFPAGKNLDSWEHPILVRIDYDFGGYKTSELAKYNQDTKKGKRPVDKAVELSAILREKELCNKEIPSIVGNYERMSDFYASGADQKRMLDRLVQCDILTQQEIPAYYTAEYGFGANGKILLEAVLSGIVLDKDAILAGDTDGVRSFRQHVITSLPVLMANKELGADSLLPYVSEAIVLQQKAVGSGLKFHDYLAQGNLFGGEETRRWTEKALYLNRLLDKGQRAFKAGITKYNATLAGASQSMGLFGDAPDSTEAFQRYVIDVVEEVDRRAIRLYLGTGKTGPATRLKQLQKRILEQRKKLAA